MFRQIDKRVTWSFMLVLGLCASSELLSSSTPHHKIVIADNHVYMANGYTADPNPWGAGSLVNGKDYTQTIVVDPTTFPNGVEFRWTFPSPSKPNFVYAYPDIKYGEGAPGGPAPTQAADFAALNAHYSVAISGDTSDFSVSFELWFTSAPGNNSTSTDELMVMIYAPGAQQPGNQPIKLSHGGLTNATVSVYPKWNAGSAWIPAGWTFIIIKNSVDALTGTINLGDIIKDLIWNGVLTGQEYIDDIQLGAEMIGGSGSLIVNNLSYQWDATTTQMGNALNISTVGGNHIVAGAGTDTVNYPGVYSAFQIKRNRAGVLIMKSGDISTLDVLENVKFIRFLDGTFDLTTAQFNSSAAPN